MKTIRGCYCPDEDAPKRWYQRPEEVPQEDVVSEEEQPVPVDWPVPAEVEAE